MEAGCWFTIEQPRSSLMLETEEIKSLLKSPNVTRVDFDQCAYVLRPPDFVRPKNVFSDVNFASSKYASGGNGMLGMKNSIGIKNGTGD